MFKQIYFCLVCCLSFATVSAQQPDTLSITLEDVPYGHPIRYFWLRVEGQDVRMGYMDISAAGSPTVEPLCCYTERISQDIIGEMLSGR